MKILIISLAGIGDTLFSTPMIKELRKKFPKSQIDMLVMWKGSKGVLKNNPDIDNVYQFTMYKEGYIRTLLFCLKLGRKKYDLSINTFPQSKKAYRLASYLIGARVRIGHIYENYDFTDKILLTKTAKEDYGIHAVENNLNLLNLINVKTKINDTYRVYISPSNIKNAESFLKENKLKGKNIISISTGTGKTKNLFLRRWPSEYYHILIEKLLKNEKNAALLITGPEEMAENQYLLKKINNKRLILVNKEDILDVAAIIKKSKIFISVDNVAMHIAAAVKVKHQVLINTPSVNNTVLPYKNKFVIVGSKVPDNIWYRYDGYGIHGKKEDIINYMKSISPEEVFQKVNKYL